jgi:hypothetical protein
MSTDDGDRAYRSEPERPLGRKSAISATGIIRKVAFHPDEAEAYERGSSMNRRLQVLRHNYLAIED